MSELAFTLARFNLAGLYASLAPVLGDVLAGIGAAGDQVMLYLTHDLTEDDRQAVQTVIATHDPDALTPDQEAEALGRIDRDALLAEIAAQRTALQDALTTWGTLTAANKDAVLRRVVAIVDRELGVWAFVLRRMAL